MRAQSNALEVGPVAIEVAAPVGLLYQMLAAIGQGVQRPGERAQILERDGDALVADFWTTIALPFGRSRVVRTREAVRLWPPDRIDYQHLDGPIRGLRETITIESLGQRHSRLVYHGAYTPGGLAGTLVFRLLSRPALEGAIRAHFADVRARAEARAARSRQFPVAAPEAGA